MKGCHAEMQASVSSHNITYVPDYKVCVEIFKLIASSLTKRILKYDIHYNSYSKYALADCRLIFSFLIMTSPVCTAVAQ